MKLYDLNTDPNISMITQDLQKKYGCHTFILYGSRARGDARETSDYDILGIRENGEEIVRDARFWNGFYLDAFIYSEAKASQVDESMLHMRGGKILFQKDEIGTGILSRVEELYQSGPKRLSLDEIQARRVWFRKMLDRARVGDIEGNFRRAWLLTALIEDYFLIRGQWYRGPKEGLQWLKANQPKLYEAYEVALQPNSSIESLEKLVHLLDS